MESRRRLEGYVAEFRKRLNSLCPNLIITQYWPEKASRANATGNGNQQGSGGKEDLSTKYNWILCMTNFVRLVFDAEVNYNSGRDNTPKLFKIERPIHVALIDDGVDTMELELSDCRLLGGRTFCRRDETRGLKNPYYASAAGHGTIMAKQILRMCPKAQLYILRLSDHRLDEGKRQIDAESAARVSLLPHAQFSGCSTLEQPPNLLPEKHAGI